MGKSYATQWKGGPAVDRLLAFIREEDGPTAVEYAVMLALILLAVFGVVGLIGLRTQELMNPDGSLLDALSG